jgi:hypothetical protein
MSSSYEMGGAEAGRAIEAMWARASKGDKAGPSGLSTKWSSKGGGARWRGYGPKDFFGRVLELGGRRATGREQVIKGSDAWREDVVDVGEDTRGCGGPWDTYSGRGGTSIGVVIRIGRMKRIKRIGHWTLRSARGSDCPNVRNALL